MSVADIWMQSDWIIRILIISLVLVFVMAFEKLYQYYKSYQDMKTLRTIKSLDELDVLRSGVMKDTLLEIKNFRGTSDSLFNSFVGVKLDMYEQYMMKFVTVMGVIAILAPMLGLIGTFIGVWHVFGGVANIGLDDPTVIARGIKEVIVDTMAGLVVAVITMVFYKLFEYVSYKNMSIFEEKLYRLFREHNA